MTRITCTRLYIAVQVCAYWRHTEGEEPTMPSSITAIVTYCDDHLFGPICDDCNIELPDTDN